MKTIIQQSLVYLQQLFTMIPIRVNHGKYTKSKNTNAKSDFAPKYNKNCFIFIMPNPYAMILIVAHTEGYIDAKKTGIYS